MLLEKILYILPLLGLGITIPLEQSSSTTHLNKLARRSDFAEWGVGADWQIRNAGSFFAAFDNGVKFALQNDGNFVIYDQNSKALWSSHTSGHTCSSGDNGNCLLTFQGDGNFVLYVNGKPKWDTKTANKGATLLLQDTPPYIVVYGTNGGPVFHTGGSPRVPDPKEPGGAPGAGGGLSTLCKEAPCVVVYQD